jgi:hypothetical protein
VDFIGKLLEIFKAALRSLISRASDDTNLRRQASPPDERDVDAAEEAADSASAPGQEGATRHKTPFPKDSKARAKKAGG